MNGKARWCYVSGSCTFVVLVHLVVLSANFRWYKNSPISVEAPGDLIVELRQGWRALTVLTNFAAVVANAAIGTSKTSPMGFWSKQHVASDVTPASANRDSSTTSCTRAAEVSVINVEITPLTAGYDWRAGSLFFFYLCKERRFFPNQNRFQLVVSKIYWRSFVGSFKNNWKKFTLYRYQRKTQFIFSILPNLNTNLTPRSNETVPHWSGRFECAPLQYFAANKFTER